MSGISTFKATSDSILDWLKKEYAGIRTNQANPGILDAVSVEVYGSRMPINQVATILGSGPKSLLITPWDSTVAPAVDRAIRESNLGVSVSIDSQGIRINFPELTSERRTILIKMVKEKLEEARIKLRNERQKVLSEIDKSESSDDEKKRVKNELQKLVDEAGKKFEEISEKKEKQIME